MARVIVSSGHTNDDPGTVIGDLREVDIARSIAKKLTPYLRFNGIITLSVPYDLDLPKRIDWINGTGYKAAQEDILLEIHINEGGKSGVEAWYVAQTKDGSSDKSRRLADIITSKIKSDTGLATQGVNDEKDHPFGGINLLQQVNPIPVLIECLYLDNQADLAFIKDDNKLESLAKAIAKGIAQFLNINFRDPKPQVKSGQNQTQDQKKLADQPQRHAQRSAPQRQDLQRQDPSRQDQQKQNQQRQNQQRQNPTAPAQFGQRPTMAAAIAPGSSFDDTDDGLDDDIDDFGGFGGGGGFNPSFPPPSNGFGGNNFGNSNFGGNNLAAPGGFGGASAAKPMTRDERKDMINKYYQKAFGKQPNQNDLNYFLNIGITEEQLLKRVLDSQDHLDQVNNAAKYAETKEKLDSLEAKAQTMERDLADQKQIMEKLTTLLQQKNVALSEMQRRIQLLVNRLEDIQNTQGPPKVTIEYKQGPLEKLISYLSKKLS